MDVASGLHVFGPLAQLIVLLYHLTKQVAKLHRYNHASDTMAHWAHPAAHCMHKQGTTLSNRCKMVYLGHKIGGGLAMAGGGAGSGRF